MCKLNKWGDTRIDPCMRNFIDNLNYIFQGCDWKIILCCCGHGRYPMTIVCKHRKGKVIEMVSDTDLGCNRKKFYKRDKKGYYFIPEVSKERR